MFCQIVNHLSQRVHAIDK